MSAGEQSEQSDDQPEVREGGARPNGEAVEPWIWAVAALVMAVPAAIPLIVLIEPAAVPFVSAMESTEGNTYWYLVGLSAVMLTLNWGFLYILRRWFNRYAFQDSDVDHGD